MLNCGAPIWEDYCPNELCTGHKGEFLNSIREASARHQAAERVRHAAPELLAAIKAISDATPDLPNPLWKQIDDAIAKAEGR
jgi:hypothetical protein